MPCLDLLGRRVFVIFRYDNQMPTVVLSLSLDCELPGGGDSFIL